MGTLGNQMPRKNYLIRKDDIDHFLTYATELAQKHSISIETVIEAKRVLELSRQNDITVQSGDYLDEQAGGFGNVLARIADALEYKE